MATELNEETFRDALQKPLALIDFWAAWCGPCRTLAPVIEKIAKEYEGRVFVGKVNVDENRELSEKYNVMSIPTLIVFEKGKPVDTSVGAVPEKEIRNMLDKYLQ
ncbi:MAG: thioredoxin [Candidatus Altiarchaeota archaeon]|nr:thioredoxin [Candidatus Altiarchaeota archaeon]